MNKKTANMAAGVLILIGFIWLLQGLNYLPGSFMTGQVAWAWAGAACMASGVWLARMTPKE